MNGKGNSLIVIESGQLNMYPLDNKLIWEVGRPSKGNDPDIKLRLSTVSRRHGRFQNMDGNWFYIDNNGKNGTVYGGKHIGTGLNGRVKPIMLKDGDVLIFGGGDDAVINNQTVWSMYTTTVYEDRWKVKDTKDYHTISIGNGDDVTKLDEPVKGTVIKKANGMIIYMGDVTYIFGDVEVTAD